MTTFYYGTAIYRPPHPPRGERRQHLERIAREVGFNIVRIWPTRTWMNPKEGEFDFAEIHEIMSACDELGLKVVANPLFGERTVLVGAEVSRCSFCERPRRDDVLAGDAVPAYRRLAWAVSGSSRGA